MNIIVGSQVWVEDPEAAWIDGLVTKINGAEAEIDLTKGKKVDGYQVLPSSFFSHFNDILFMFVDIILASLMISLIILFFFSLTICKLWKG